MSDATAIALPGRRVEDWKYSDLRTALGDDGFGVASARAVTGPAPDGVERIDLGEAVRPGWVTAHLGKLRQSPVSAVSLAHARGGVALRVGRGQAVALPLALDLTGEGHVRVLLVLEDGASLTLVEHGDVAARRNIGFEIVLGAHARLDHLRLSPAAPGAVQVEEIAMRLAQGARYDAHYASFGAKLSRLELDIVLEGEGAEARLSGVSVLGGETHADVTTRIHHAVGRTQSSQVFKKVAGGKSRAVYQGRVHVAQGSNGSDSRQTAKALLLGMRAEADLKPELEIFADDVKCAHGAAVGDLDADSLFYLRARGIPETQARALLIQAFLEDAFSGIARDELREQVRAAVDAALKDLA